MQIETIPYAGWDNCYRLANGLVELVEERPRRGLTERVVRAWYLSSPRVQLRLTELADEAAGPHGDRGHHGNGQFG